MSELETKAGAGNVGAAFEDFMRAFEAFKETNDERLDALERRSAADPLIEEKLSRIDRALDDHRRTVDDLALKAARPALGGSAPRSGTALAHKAAFESYVRKGEAGRLRDLESKALSVGTGIDGEMGPLTLGAVARLAVADALRAYAEARRARYRALPHFWRFGRGWLARVDTTLSRALAIAAEAPSAAAPKAPPAQQKGSPAMTDATPTDSKWWGQSMTIWGALITALSTVLPALGPALGVDITADLVRQLGEQVVQTVQVVGGLIGTILTIYGRARATQPLARRDMTVKF